ncbi:MAG: DUF5606 domain-containing protein [Dysgonamonadaceae bacterium]|jgi:hypothetical protein|nr:DUF5606 domain-containing protein [Dysgonamonadaceae bacterium]
MLKKILTVSGKPGLFKLVSQGKNMNIVESLVDGKRFPTYPRDKIMSLGDISIYTSSDEVSLTRVLASVKEKENGQKINTQNLSQPEQLRKFFSEILPDFDRGKVYPSDIKKIINWYNLLSDAGMTDFTEASSQEENAPEETPADEPHQDTPEA